MTAVLVAASAAVAGQEPRAGNRAATPQPSRSKDDLHAGQVERARKGCDVLFLGDSITSLWMRKPGWKPIAASYKAANLAVGGENTRNVLWRIRTLEELEGVRARVVVINVGTNNMGSDAAEDIAEAVHVIVGEVRRRLSEAKVLLMGIFPKVVEAGDRREKIRRTNALLAGFADGESVRFLDIGDRFLTPAGGLDRESIGDGVHPTAKGYDVWWSAMEPALKEMLLPTP